MFTRTLSGVMRKVGPIRYDNVRRYSPRRPVKYLTHRTSAVVARTIYGDSAS